MDKSMYILWQYDD